MAPEVIESRNISPACDIWSLGCTIIELIAATPPFSDAEPLTALFRMVQEPCPPYPLEISVFLNEFLSRCFQRNPMLRSRAKELLSHNWIRNFGDDVRVSHIL